MQPDIEPLSSEQRPAGVRAFTVIWVGQIVSLTGSAMSLFALTIWAWQTTGEATALALVSFFSYIPTLLFTPLAGALVDRWNRKLVMMLSDLGTASATLAVLLLYAAGYLQVWHLYVVGVFAGVFMAFQYPAYSAAATMMLPKEHYARAAGMIGLAQSAVYVLAPILSSILLGVIGLAGVIIIDMLTFLVALGTLLWVHVPNPERVESGSIRPQRFLYVYRVYAPNSRRVESGQRDGKDLWEDMVYGFNYIFQRRSLLGIQAVFFIGNFWEALSLTLIAPLILARTNSQIIYGSIESIGAVGGIAGGIVMSLWGGPRRRVRGLLLGWAASNLLGILLMGLGRGFLVWSIASFSFAFLSPLVNGLDQSIWQSKVAPDAQGRVFAARMIGIELPILLAKLVAGPLADSHFEPAMLPAGKLANAFGWLVGTGRGAGMALILVWAGILGTAAVLGGYASQTIRDAESILPDYDGRIISSS